MDLNCRDGADGRDTTSDESNDRWFVMDENIVQNTTHNTRCGIWQAARRG
jgi:hypothetical protein